MHRRAAPPFPAWSLTLIASIFFLASQVFGDVIYLKDGSKVEGEIIQKTEAGWVVKTVDGKTEKIAVDRVKSFEAKRNAPGSGGEDPLARLNSLRRSLESQSDIRKILERYQKFIEQNMGTPAADEAVKDVAVWEDRLDKQMVKVGDKWLTKAEQEALKAKSIERGVEIRQLLLASRAKEANVAIDAALAENPANAAALYLRGVLLHRQAQIANARKAFDAVAQLSPNHGPTLNNIAVIMWSTKALPGAMNFYGQAMNAAPGNRQILDNVAEALNELPEVQRDNAVTKKVVLLFNAQDMGLQGRMKKRRLFRWGSTWVEEKDLKELKAQEEMIEDKLDALEEDYKQVQDRLEQIARDVSDTERSIRRIEAASYGRDSSGRAVRYAYPRLYYDLKHDLDQMHTEQASETEKASRLRKKAKDLKQSITVPRYTGAQQIIGVDGAPDLPPLSEVELKGEGEVKPVTVPVKPPIGAPVR